MILEIAGPYSRGIAWMHQRGRVGLAHTLYCSCSNAIAVSALVGDDVEQDHFKAGIRGLCGDARAHHPRADNGNFTYYGHLGGLEYGGDTLSAANALGRKGVASPLPFQQLSGLARDARPGCAQRMADRNGAAINIHFCCIKLQIPNRRD